MAEVASLAFLHFAFLQLCGAGACLDDGSCLCDAGYAGQSCDKVCPGSKPEVFV